MLAAVIVWFLLKYTMLGRGIYALGGSREAAERAGFNIPRIQYFIYGTVGFLAGIGGIVYASLNRQANPQELVGTELNVIAAVVLGGASITGGRGTVIGTLLGVALVVIMNNSLVLIGVPSEWQRVVIGVDHPDRYGSAGAPSAAQRQARRRPGRRPRYPSSQRGAVMSSNTAKPSLSDRLLGDNTVLRLLVIAIADLCRVQHPAAGQVFLHRQHAVHGGAVP